jgi:hypothetical protein
VKVWQFYALWINRNGMHLWEGPYPAEDRAKSALDMITDARQEGSGRILRESVEVTE